jgi:ribosomal protein S12 methylthiotransferase accessory factor
MFSGNNFRIQSCLKHYTYDQDKTVEPSETVRVALERLKKQFDLSSLRIERRQDAVEGAYSFSSLSDQLNASGKGLTPEQSQASAIMEFAERYSWLHFDCEKYEGYRIASYNEIVKGDIPTIDPAYFLVNFIELKDREAILAEIKDLPLKWITGISLNDYRKFYYPINWHNYVFTSNGLATGNAMEEAVVQALCEVIERENVARLFRDKRVANDVDLESIKNPLTRTVLDNARTAGIKIMIKDISFDFQIPTFIVCGTRESDRGKLTYRGVGQGTHPDPEKAIIRSLAEYFESYSLMKNVQDEVPLDWGALLARMPAKHMGFLALFNPEMLDQSKRTVQVKDIRDISRPDIKQEIEHILKVLKKFGHDVFFFEKTHPELNIPVCRVWVPGFRSVIVNEMRDTDFIMSEAYFEGGDTAAAESHFKRSLLKSSIYFSEYLNVAKPERMFKQNYKENLLAFGGFKKDAKEIMRKYAGALQAFRPK